MRHSGMMLGLISLMILGHSTASQASYTLASATAVSNYNSNSTNLGDAVSMQAATTIYSNITNFSGEGFANGGAATTFLGTTTAMAADDITPGAGTAGTAVTSITFSVANLNTAAVAANVVLYIYDSSGTGGGPGNVLAAIEFNAISFTAGSVATYTYTPGTTIFNTPSGTFWAGESFVASGTTTTAQLNNLGEGIFAPPTVGTSQDAFFLASSSSSTDTNNPAGGFEYFGGSPPADFGFAFSGTLAAVPEPSSLALTSLAGVILAFARARKAAIARRPS